MPLTRTDDDLLMKCFSREPEGWMEFVDRFMGLFVRVVNHAAAVRGVQLDDDDRDEYCTDICVALLQNDFAVLRKYRGASSLAAYLTVVSRRVVLHRMLALKTAEAVDSCDKAATQEEDLAGQDGTEHDEIGEDQEAMEMKLCEPVA